jgi:hypothetical protein
MLIIKEEPIYAFYQLSAGWSFDGCVDRGD